MLAPFRVNPVCERLIVDQASINFRAHLYNIFQIGVDHKSIMAG